MRLVHRTTTPHSLDNFDYVCCEIALGALFPFEPHTSSELPRDFDNHCANPCLNVNA
jgi:hypothetical protein